MNTPTLVPTFKKNSHPTCIGFLVSFIGSLPPGTTNIILVNIAGADRVAAAIAFALGCLTAELICVSLCLIIIHKMYRFPAIERLLQWLSLALLTALSFLSFLICFGDNPDNRHVLHVTDGTFVIGFVMMIFNPVQIPFWLGWTLIIHEQRSAAFTFVEKGFYLIGIGLGSLFVSALFIFAGQLLSEFFLEHYRVIQFIIGFTFGIMAFMQARKILLKSSQ